MKKLYDKVITYAKHMLEKCEWQTNYNVEILENGNILYTTYYKDRGTNYVEIASENELMQLKREDYKEMKKGYRV